MNLLCLDIALAAGLQPNKKVGAEHLFHCPRHHDEHPSLNINPTKNAFFCGPCSAGGTAWNLAAFLAHLNPDDKPAVAEYLRGKGLLTDNGSDKKPVAIYTYTDAAGKVLYEKVRYEPKTFRLRRSDGNGGYIYTLKGIEPVLYNLPATMEAKSILFVEGEKDCETAKSHGIVATTSGGVNSWRPEFAKRFKGKRVAIIADSDDPGRDHARKVAAALIGVAEWVKVLDLNMYGAKDLTQYLAYNTELRSKASLLHLIKIESKVTAEKVAGWTAPKDQQVQTAEPVGTLLADVKLEKVEWLWRNRIPLGKITILDGDPGLGKSLLTLEIAARLSRNQPLHGESSAVDGGTVLLSAEDGLGDTIRPRLEAAGADLERIVALKYTPDKEGEKTVSNIPVDIPTIIEAIERVKAKLVIVDVLMAYLPSQTNTYRDQDVRLALAPLAEMAGRHGVTVICVRHLTKAPGGNPIYRGGGSIGIIGGARAGLLVAKDPDNSEMMVLAQTKSNLGPPMPSLTYQIETTSNGIPRIVWIGESQQTAASLLAASAGDEEERGALADAKDFLEQELCDGPRKVKELERLAENSGINTRTLRRAREAIVTPQKMGVGKDGYWAWKLKNPKDDHIHEYGHLKENGGFDGDLTTSQSGSYPKMTKDDQSKDDQCHLVTFDELENPPSDPPEIEPWEET